MQKKSNLLFLERSGHRNIDVAFAAFLNGERLQFNTVAEQKYFLTSGVNYYIAVDKQDKLQKY